MGPLSATLSHSFSHCVEDRPFPPSPSHLRGKRNSGTTSSPLREPEEPPRGLGSSLSSHSQLPKQGVWEAIPFPYPIEAHSLQWWSKSQNIDQIPSILLCPSSPRSPEFLRALGILTQNEKGGENQSVASGKNIATNHLGAVKGDLHSSAGWSLGLAAGY